MRPAGVVGADTIAGMVRVVLAEDDPAIAVPLSQALVRAGYQVHVTGDGAETLSVASAGGTDLLILDLGLPVLDGLEVCRRLRAGGFMTPVLILTARHNELDTVVGLDAGADDYLVKPFRKAELLARCRALLRRGPRQPNHDPQRQTVRVDVEARRAWVGATELSLTRKEFALLTVLVREAGRAVPRSSLTEEVWPSAAATKSLDVHVSTLRRKLGAAGDGLVTVRGVGFRFDPQWVSPTPAPLPT